MTFPVLSDSSVVRPAPTQISASFLSQTLLIDIPTGSLYTLEGAGARVWALLQESPHSVSRLAQTLEDLYEVDAGLCRRDLFCLLRSLLEEGFLEVADGGAP